MLRMALRLWAWPVLAVFLSLAVASPAAAKSVSVLVDAKDGTVLRSDGANALWYPASLTKMMTAFMVFDAAKAGKLHFAEDTGSASASLKNLGNIVVAGWFTADADFDPSPGTAMRYSAGGLDAFVAKSELLTLRKLIRVCFEDHGEVCSGVCLLRFGQLPA